MNSTSCQSTLSSTPPCHTADRIDFYFLACSYVFVFFRTVSGPFTMPGIHALPRSSGTSNSSRGANSQVWRKNWLQMAPPSKVSTQLIRQWNWFKTEKKGDNSIKIDRELWDCCRAPMYDTTCPVSNVGQGVSKCCVLNSPGTKWARLISFVSSSWVRRVHQCVCSKYVAAVSAVSIHISNHDQLRWPVVCKSVIFV